MTATTTAVAVPHVSDETILSWLNGVRDLDIRNDEIERLCDAYDIPEADRAAFRSRANLLMDSD